MKNMKFLIVSIALILASGCGAPAKIAPLAPVDDSVKSTLTIYRVSEFFFAGAKCVVGIDDDDRFVLSNKQVATVTLPAGEHEIYVRDSQSDRRFSIATSLERGQAECYKVFPSENTILGNLFFFGATLIGHTFLMEKTVCSGAALEGYAPVAVEYREP